MKTTIKSFTLALASAAALILSPMAMAYYHGYGGGGWHGGGWQGGGWHGGGWHGYYYPATSPSYYSGYSSYPYYYDYNNNDYNYNYDNDSDDSYRYGSCYHRYYSCIYHQNSYGQNYRVCGYQCDD